MDENWEDYLDKARDDMHYELGKKEERIRDLEDNSKRLGGIIDKLEDRIAQIRTALQPILDCAKPSGGVGFDCVGMREMQAVEKANAIMAKDPDQYHADYHMCDAQWERAVTRDLCIAIDPITDLVDPDKLTREELLEAVNKCRASIKKSEKEFARIGQRRKAVREAMQRKGEW